MADIRMGPAETQFAEIIWEHEPIASGELSKLAEEKLNWKKTTSFTVIKRLSERGIIQNQKGIVTSLISREEIPGCSDIAFSAMWLREWMLLIRSRESGQPPMVSMMMFQLNLLLSKKPAVFKVNHIKQRRFYYEEYAC